MAAQAANAVLLARYGLVEGIDGGKVRDVLVLDIFLSLDIDGDGLINNSELLPFVCLTGFKGTPEQWESEFLGLCLNLGSPAREGLSLAVFRRRLDGDAALSCPDEELHHVRALLLD